MSKPRIHILALGGTIATRPDASGPPGSATRASLTQTSGYSAGESYSQARS